MMVRVASLAPLLALVLACEGSDGLAPDVPIAESIAATPSEPPAEEDERDTTGATESTSVEEPSATPAPVTCASIAAAPPAGKLAEVRIHKAYAMKPVDVFATVNGGRITITLSKHANECSYRANGLNHADVDELSVTLPVRDKAVPFQVVAESIVREGGGAACLTEPAPAAIGTAISAQTARGKVTITAMTETSLEGKIDVRDVDGHRIQLAFVAPICPEARRNDVTGAACCAN
ncbi:MAG: hypothetical protein KIT84_00880 [Labilithrix sp.]|nr:hypothetical protein [Labilithrix sp.]MCW5809538.1 hypothetical protein [Labilithrix sp.]